MFLGDFGAFQSHTMKNELYIDKKNELLCIMDLDSRSTHERECEG